MNKRSNCTALGEKSCGQVDELWLMRQQMVRGSSSADSWEKGESGESRSGALMPSWRCTARASCCRGCWPIDRGGRPKAHTPSWWEKLRWRGHGMDRSSCKTSECTASTEPNVLCLPLVFPLHLTFPLIWSKSGNEIYRKGQTRKKWLHFCYLMLSEAHKG